MSRNHLSILLILVSESLDTGEKQYLKNHLVSVLQKTVKVHFSDFLTEDFHISEERLYITSFDKAVEDLDKVFRFILENLEELESSKTADFLQNLGKRWEMHEINIFKDLIHHDVRNDDQLKSIIIKIFPFISKAFLSGVNHDEL